jgi:hypothetical protein
MEEPIETEEDYWLIYEAGQSNLGSLLCKIETEER